MENVAIAVLVAVDDDEVEGSIEGVDSGLVPTVDVASDVAVPVTDTVPVPVELVLAVAVGDGEEKLDAVKTVLAELLGVAEREATAVVVVVIIDVWVANIEIEDEPVIVPGVVTVLLAIVENEELDEGVSEKQAVRVAVSVEFLSYVNDAGGDLEVLDEAEQEAE